jgi:hypothetical protein
MNKTPPEHRAPVVVREGERWYTLDTHTLVNELLFAGYTELPPVRAFVRNRPRWDTRRTFINIASNGKVRIGGNAPDEAEALLAALAESEVSF